jgi:hypothetical protein
MDDERFVHDFFASLEGGFHHRDHLRLTWLALERGTPELVGHVIRRFAAAHGAERKYHETITEFWIRLVRHARKARPQIDDFDEFLDTFPLLLDKTIAARHWSAELLRSNDARERWREPDLRRLPA